MPVPDTRITSEPRDTTRARTATFRFAAAGPGAPGASFECSLDGSAFAACTSPQTYRDLSDGEHEVRVRAVSAGGADTTPATATWTVDRTAPRIRKVAPKGSTRDRAPTIGATVTDRHSAVRAGEDYTLVVDGKRVRGVRYDARRDRMAWTPKRGMSPGRHTVRLVAKDALHRDHLGPQPRGSDDGVDRADLDRAVDVVHAVELGGDLADPLGPQGRPQIAHLDDQPAPLGSGRLGDPGLQLTQRRCRRRPRSTSPANTTAAAGALR